MSLFQVRLIDSRFYLVKLLPTSVAMWVFKTAGASMKGSQVGNRSAGRIGDTGWQREPNTGNGFIEYCILAVFYKVFRGERAPNAGERICKIIDISYVLKGFSRGTGSQYEESAN